MSLQPFYSVTGAYSAIKAYTAIGTTLSLLCLSAALGQEETFEPPEVPAVVDLDDVPVDRALRLLSEIYDISIATGQLPDVRVTVRLRGVSVDDAFESVATAAGLEVARHGSIVLVSPRVKETGVRRIALGPFPPETKAGLDWLPAAGVEARWIDPATLVLEGPEGAVRAASEALDGARRRGVVDRVFHLGVAPGEETLQALQPLLAPDFESATYDAIGHLLTVSALPATIHRVESLLAELTRPSAQFEIEVRVVEISRSALKRMGAQGTFQLDIRGGVLATSFPLTGFDDSSRYFPSPNDLATLGNTVNAGAGTSGEPGSLEDSGFRFGRVNARGVGLLIEFLEQSGEARVMATPRVTALDNRQARISMVTTLRIPTFTQNGAFATTTVSGIEQVDVGTTLEVRPRRGEKRQILLTVTPEVSELEPTVEIFTQSGLTQGLPVVTRRRTETEVLLEAGETLVIGGLVNERQVDTLGKTPGLGDIPLIGRAFRLKGKESDSAELLVFVTPRELPPPEERRSRARVDDVWIPAGLAARLDAARTLMAGKDPAHRVAGVRAVARIDGELRAEGVEVGPDVVRLGADSHLEVRVEAALFLLRRRPESALGELVRFANSRAVALSALAMPMAPHLRAALAELVGQAYEGTELLVRQLDTAVKSGEQDAARHLFEALCVAAPELAASKAAEWTGRADAGVVTTLQLDALSEAPGHESELARQAVHAESVELRAFALAALVRALGPGDTAELLAGRSPIQPADSLGRRIRALEPYATSRRATEPALAWSGTPAEIVIHGDGAGIGCVEEALDVLAGRAPDLRHLVGFALATIEVGTGDSSVDPALRRAVVESCDVEPERLALRLVRLATIVFESRVRGFPATGGRSLARAVREEVRALERLTGAPCPPERVAAIVRQVLLAASPVGAGGV